MYIFYIIILNIREHHFEFKDFLPFIGILYLLSSDQKGESNKIGTS